jgi:cytochrome c oxidase assembly protein subunit 15
VIRASRFSVVVLAWSLFVVIWGAFVRATGSGAGCGSHWPLCNGVVVPTAPAAATLIELTHRLTSGLALVAVAVLLFLVRRERPPGHPARAAAVASVVFMVSEAAVGAGLVLLELVGRDDSLTRAAWMAGHLLNTYFLIAALALTTWWLRDRPRPRRPAGMPGLLLGLAGLGMLVVGATGAVTALGDTLFPASSLVQGLRQDVAPAAHALVRLRIFHPLAAIALGLFLLWLPQGLRPHLAARPDRRLGGALGLLTLAQLTAGAVNVTLLAPVPMQLVHLLLAQLLWIAFVLFASETLAIGPRGESAGQ